MKNLIKIVKEFVKKYLGNSQYKKNVSVMVSGRVVAQIIPILLTPLLTRIYSPEEFGVFAVYSTIVSIIAMVSNGRYCLATLLSKDERESKGLVFISSILSIAVTMLLTVILILIGKDIFLLLNVEILERYKYILILNVLLLGLFEVLFYYVLRIKSYKPFVIIMIVQALVLVVGRIVFGYAGETESGLIISYFLSYIVTDILLVIHLKVFKNLKNSNIKWEDIIILLKKYKKFPQYTLFADTLSMSSNLSPNILLNKIFSGIEVGYFSLSEKVLGAPLWVITASVGDVFRQEAAEQYRSKGSCVDIFRKTAKGLFFLGFFPFLGIFLIVPILVPFLFGPGWEPVSDYIRIFTVMYFAKFVVTPVSHVNYIINKQKYNIFFQGLRFTAILLGFGIGFYTNNIRIGLIVWSILSSLVYLIIFIISYRLVLKAPNPEKERKEHK